MTLQQPVESLLDDLPWPKVRYKVVLTLTRAAEGCEPGSGQVLAELAAAALAAEGLLTAWAAEQVVLSMILDAEDDAGALAAGAAVARALGASRGASVSVERYDGNGPIGLLRALAQPNPRRTALDRRARAALQVRMMAVVVAVLALQERVSGGDEEAAETVGEVAEILEV